MVYMEQALSCCRPLVQCGGYVPVRDKSLVHPYLQCGGGGSFDLCRTAGEGLQAAAGAVVSVVVFVWQIAAFLLAMIGKYHMFSTLVYLLSRLSACPT